MAVSDSSTHSSHLPASEGVCNGGAQHEPTSIPATKLRQLLKTPRPCQSPVSVGRFSQTPRPCLDTDFSSPRISNDNLELVGSTSEASEHQAELCTQLQELMSQHEQHLQHVFQSFLESFKKSIDATGEQTPSQAAAANFLSLPRKRPPALTRAATSSSSGRRTDNHPPFRADDALKSSKGSSYYALHQLSPGTDNSQSCGSDEHHTNFFPGPLKTSNGDCPDSFSTGPSISKTASQPSDGDCPVIRRMESAGSLDSMHTVKSTKYNTVEEVRILTMSRTKSWSSRTTRTSAGEEVVSRMRLIVNSFIFELIFATLICLNSFQIGVEVAIFSSSPTDDVPHIFYYLTIIFTCMFVIELSMRLAGDGGLISFLFWSDARAWNWFDLFVVLCSLIEVGFNFVLLGGGSQSITRIMRMARMSRLMRVLRVARIVRFVKELRVLVISILSTLQTLLWALFLLFIIIYMFAVLLAQATAEYFSEDPSYKEGNLEGQKERLAHYWGSLHASMYTLFMAISGGFNWEGAVFPIAEVNWFWAALFTCFIAFASFALINVMTAVFCQSAIETAQRNMDVKWQRKCADKHRHIDILKKLFKSLDSSTKGTISMSKLERCWDDEAMQAFRMSMDLEPEDFWTFFMMLNKTEGYEVSAHDFVEGCLRLKGSAKSYDIAVMTYELRHLSKQNVKFMNQMQDCMQILLGLIGQDGQLSPLYRSGASY